MDDRGMSRKRIVEETPCERCGMMHAGQTVLYSGCFGDGGFRRLLTLGQFILIEADTGLWPEWAWSRLQDYRTDGTETIDLLDALADRTQSDDA